MSVNYRINYVNVRQLSTCAINCHTNDIVKRYSLRLSSSFGHLFNANLRLAWVCEAKWRQLGDKWSVCGVWKPNNRWHQYIQLIQSRTTLLQFDRADGIDNSFNLRREMDVTCLAADVMLLLSIGANFFKTFPVYIRENSRMEVLSWTFTLRAKPSKLV